MVFESHKFYVSLLYKEKGIEAILCNLI